MLLTLSHTFNPQWKFTGQLAYLLYEQEGQSLWPTSVSADGDTLFRAVSNWDVLGQTKVGQFFLNGSFTTVGINHHLLAGLDMGDKDYYHDWSQGGSIGPLAIYNPVYGQIPAGGYPVYDRERSIRERGVYYQNAYYAAYLQDELHLFGDKLRLTLAGRYTSVSDVDPYSGNGAAAKLTPRIGISYSLDKNTSLYGVYDMAFVPQLGRDFHDKSFKPVTGDNREIGLKRDGQLRLYRWKNHPEQRCHGYWPTNRWYLQTHRQRMVKLSTDGRFSKRTWFLSRYTICRGTYQLVRDVRQQPATHA